MIDLTDQRFGKLVAKYRIDTPVNTPKKWFCVCDCGNSSIVSQGHLRSGHTKSCGCNKNLLKDLTGQVFSYLTVIKRVDDYVSPKNGKQYSQWLCRCVCGNMTIVTTSNLKQGGTKSCGCKKPTKFQNLVGLKFGDLVVTKLLNPYVNSSGRKLVQYQCKCSCGKYITALANTLRSGDVTSCGCKLNSKGEAVVKDYLDNHSIDYDFHKSFKDCLSDKGHRLNFDFYVEKYNLLIECHGIQHYEPVVFFGGHSQYLSQIRHDTIKYDYAKTHQYDYLVLDCRKENLNNVKSKLEIYFNS